ncbi:MAG: cell division protein FtsW [Elusimicrobia bacterium RIFCSPLOWO2_02_FULL_39_32]|nr:MAG: cell division protein FtsW [Elusimicrobia bacterium GWA2_38_7]OGR79263.1 MAG: cell division protein FtsW [Elusimicrobia bacterium RIFCSPHIGHO2_02_FULL_39_36]OGR93163.1 MAG: cell division protein FtsW [Elusimicrobia bacterium RIFCSPLOWO2_02_FULL_39_32]OGR99388.1 MAG: cell division protein FtsW [Elusimicrobia bacterium RIFCSPLOWO2_12_FULL_39_28]
MKTRYPPDPILLSIILALLGLGLVANYSSSAIFALERYGSSTYFLWKQFLWIVIGIALALFFINYDHRKLKSMVRPLLVLNIILLILVLILGREVGGAKRWLRFLGLGFQPSEITKLSLIIFVAYYCDKKRSKIENFSKGLLPLLLVIGFFCGMIFLQPDLGTPVLIGFTCIVISFIGGAKLKQILSLGMLLLPLISLAAWAEPYRRKRILSFLHPWDDPQGSGYQLVQSLLALGSGGLKGVGLGQSHSKLLYLPEPHTDFIFPILAEELGLLGSLSLLLLYGLLGWIGFRIATRTKNMFSSLLASGITLIIVLQALFNIGAVSGCIPTKGLPLPLISFGGSSLVITLMSLGILSNISRYARKE